MGILDITTENYEVTVKDVAKEMEVSSSSTYLGNRIAMTPGEQMGHHKNARHVEKIIANQLIRNIGRISPCYPTGKQVREVVESILNMKVSCHMLKYTGYELRNTVRYDLAERGQVGINRSGIVYKDSYKGTQVEVRIHSINITY